MVDYTDTPINMNEILFVKVNHCSDEDIMELFWISKVFGTAIIDYDGTTVLLECTQTENRIEIVKGGSVAVEAVSMSER